MLYLALIIQIVLKKIKNSFIHKYDISTSLQFVSSSSFAFSLFRFFFYLLYPSLIFLTHHFFSFLFLPFPPSTPLPPLSSPSYSSSSFLPLLLFLLLPPPPTLPPLSSPSSSSYSSSSFLPLLLFLLPPPPPTLPPPSASPPPPLARRTAACFGLRF